jgi:hypothetical protein
MLEYKRELRGLFLGKEVCPFLIEFRKLTPPNFRLYEPEKMEKFSKYVINKMLPWTLSVTT